MTISTKQLREFVEQHRAEMSAVVWDKVDLALDHAANMEARVLVAEEELAASGVQPDVEAIRADARADGMAEMKRRVVELLDKEGGG